MTLQEITAKMKEGAAKKSSFGNTVKFATDQGVVYIDGKELIEPYLDPTVVTPTQCGGGQPPITIPADQVFVMGDNRGGSKDSRNIGAIQYSDLLGRAFVIIWPKGHWGWL